jgi:hypothetical protein
MEDGVGLREDEAARGAKVEEGGDEGESPA